MNPIITLKGATKRFPNGRDIIEALSNVSFELSPGELVAVTGRSGSGKSTLLKICAGIEQVDTGEVTVAGTSLVDVSPQLLAQIRREHIGVVFQQLNLLPSLTARENVALPLELGGTAVRDATAAAERALESVGLAERLALFPDQLSGGEQQRVAIARALVGTRKILLADEPTAALDERTGDQILSLLREQADNGAAVMLVTHDRSLAGLADRVVDLRDGEIHSIVQRPDVDTELAEMWQ